MSASFFRLDIEYDGTSFSGWAAQPGLRTVQGEIERALATVLREPVALAVAGRTDTGVHALGQVASFSTEASVPERLAGRLNGLLPDDVAICAATPARQGFDARRDARSRSYRYRILARHSPSPFEAKRALWWPQPLDRSALAACAEALVGTHDFTAFTPTQTHHVRFERVVMAAAWEEGTGGAGSPTRSSSPIAPETPRGVPDPAAGDILVFEVSADAFMRNMVRVLLGTMLEVAGGRRTIDDFTRLLGGASRSEAGHTAPAHGLYLASVQY